MKDDQIINKKYHILQRNKIFKNNNKFIYDEIAHRVNNSLENINFSINNCLEIGYSSKQISNYILSRFKKINYTTADISQFIINNLNSSYEKILLDHDQWNLSNKKFDIIISNFYLHLTNNLKLLLKNITQSLNSNGFLMITMPGKNCHLELKQAMINADIAIYGGAYRRFMEYYSPVDLANLLKSNNLNTPVIEIDNIQLKYTDFYSLLYDVRSLGHSNMYVDRKINFDKKKYFKKVEEIYWKKFSNDNKIILNLEVISISAWKNIKVDYN